MIVLHHLDQLTESGCVLIPAFQAGHLGFIPKRSVQIYLLKENENPPVHCEVTVTPFEARGRGDLLRLVCVMDERAGVVKLLLKALALLNVNVVAQESSTIQHQKYHYVSMIIDISTSESLRRRTDRNEYAESIYVKESAIAPFHQRRYVELFETIMAYCGDKITFTDRGLPRLSIRPFDMDENPLFPKDTTIRRASIATVGNKKGVVVKLNNKLVGTIRRYLGIPTGHPLSYFLVSETEYRRLRIIFIKEDQSVNLLQVGFSHNDIPGSLNSIMNVLSDRNFSIITSLHRSIDQERSIWESILWYQGNGFPKTTDPQSLLEWLARKLTSRMKPALLADIINKNIKICAPLYPYDKDLRKLDEIPLERFISSLSKGKVPKPLSESEKWNLRTSEMVQELDRGIKELQNKHDEATSPAIEMLERIKMRRKAKPIIFISCTASSDVNSIIDDIEFHINKHFKNFFVVDKYRTPDSAVAVDVVRGKVSNCNGFIGIWHEDKTIPLRSDPLRYGTSPWMLYEFGQAHALGKDCFLVHSSNIDSRFYTAITPGYIMIEYNNNNFVKVVMPGLIKWCRNLKNKMERQMQ